VPAGIPAVKDIIFVDDGNRRIAYPYELATEQKSVPQISGQNDTL
jgi:hypothetical protein